MPNCPNSSLRRFFISKLRFLVEQTTHELVELFSPRFFISSLRFFCLGTNIQQTTQLRSLQAIAPRRGKNGDGACTSQQGSRRKNYEPGVRPPLQRSIALPKNKKVAKLPCIRTGPKFCKSPGRLPERPRAGPFRRPRQTSNIAKMFAQRAQTQKSKN